jgi:hypothetical protein
MNDVYQVDLEPHRKDIVFGASMGYIYISINFPLLSSFLSFCPTQGHPTEASGIHSDTYPIIWIK